MRVRTVFLVRCDIFKISSAPREMGRVGWYRDCQVKTKINPPQKKLLGLLTITPPPPPKRKKIYIYILGPKINASPSPEKKNILMPKFLGLKNDSMILHNNNQKCLLNFPLPQNPECFDHPCHYKYRVSPSPSPLGYFITIRLEKPQTLEILLECFCVVRKKLIGPKSLNCVC